MSSYSAVAHYNKREIEKVIASYAGAIPIVLNERYNLPEPDCFTIGDILSKVFKEHHHQIVIASSVRIAEYLQEYGVNCVNGVDQFKISFFVGETLRVIFRERLKGAVAINETILKSIQYITIKQLDHCIKQHRSAKGRKILMDRIIQQIESGTTQEHFGKYGIYIIYKACSNTALELKQESS